MRTPGLTLKSEHIDEEEGSAWPWDQDRRQTAGEGQSASGVFH